MVALPSTGCGSFSPMPPSGSRMLVAIECRTLANRSAGLRQSVVWQTRTDDTLTDWLERGWSAWKRRSERIRERRGG